MTVRLMVSPALIGEADASSGMIRETYFSPKSVLGTIDAVTLSGIVSTWLGKSPSVSSAPSAVALMSSTSPTMTPRIFTSARAGSCSPILEVSTLTRS